jgi:DNA-binding HxlR family transcriptional regulator
MLEGMKPQVNKPACKVRSILESLDDKDKQILIQALSDDQWTATALARELTARGIPISDKRVMVHKRKECSCA